MRNYLIRKIPLDKPTQMHHALRLSDILPKRQLFFRELFLVCSNFLMEFLLIVTKLIHLMQFSNQWRVCFILSRRLRMNENSLEVGELRHPWRPALSDMTSNNFNHPHLSQTVKCLVLPIPISHTCLSWPAVAAHTWPFPPSHGGPVGKYHCSP